MKSFTDSRGWFRWVNTTPWATEDIQGMVEAVFGLEDVSLMKRDFYLQTRTITVRETTADLTRLVDWPSYSRPEVMMVKRSRFFENPVEALASANQLGSDAAPPKIVRALAMAILHVYARDPMSSRPVKMVQLDVLADRLTAVSKLTLKKNVLEPGEQEVNSTLRLRSYRQSRVSSHAARRANDKLYVLLARAANFERNGVGVAFTEHEQWVLEEARRVLSSVQHSLDNAASQHINMLRSVE